VGGWVRTGKIDVAINRSNSADLKTNIWRNCQVVKFNPDNAKCFL